MDPLNWTDYSGASKAELTAELRALGEHLGRWAPGQQDTEVLPALLTFLDTGELIAVSSLDQSFLPAVEILRLRLRAGGQDLDGVFLRQRTARGVPNLWPVADRAANLYRFFDAIPGVLDMTRANVIDYGLWFANEAITGEEGRFAFYRDLSALPADTQQEIRAAVAAQSRAAPDPIDPPSPLLDRVAALLDRDPKSGPSDFERLDYSREHDDYFFSVFVGYAGQMWAALIRVNRATGEPQMDEECSLGAAPSDPPHLRLPAFDMSAALGILVAPPKSVLPDDGLAAITPEAAAAALVAHGLLENAHVTGDLALDRRAAPGSVILKNCAIDGTVRLDGIEVGADVVIERVTIGGNLQLAAARLGGQLALDRLTVAGIIDLSDALVTLRVYCTEVRTASLVARHLSVVRGAFHAGPRHDGEDLAGLITSDTVSFSGASATSGFKITDSHIGGPLLFADCRTSGNIQLGAAAETRTFVRGRLDLSGAQVGADVLIRGVHVGGDVVMFGGSIAGHLRFGSAHRELAHAGEDCTIGRDLALTNCEIKGPLTLGGVHLRGTLRLELCNLGSVIAEGRILSDPGFERIAVIAPTVIRNGIEILACQIRGEVRLCRALVDERYAGRFALEMTSTTVGQSVSFWDEGTVEPRTTETLVSFLDDLAGQRVREAHRSEPGQQRRARWTLGPFDDRARPAGWPIMIPKPRGDTAPAVPAKRLVGESSSTTIRTEISIGELEAHLSARHTFTEIHGDVRFALCKIGGDLSLDNLRARGHRIVIESLTIQGDLLADWKGRRYSVPAEAWAQPLLGLLETVGGVLDVSGTTLIGEARLTGLRLSGLGPAAPRGPTLAVRHSKIDGVLSLCDAGTDGASHELECARARIQGDLDVSWSTMDQLVLDGRSIGAPSGPHGAAGGRPNRLVATNATIRKLELRDPLPGEVDLADARVMVWDFGQAEGAELLGRFRNVLDNQKPFKRNVYQEVEAYLYNAGFEALAKDVHMELVARQHRYTIERLDQAEPNVRSQLARLGARFARTLSSLNWFMTGNFTSELRPIFFCWLPVWLISSCYFADPARIDVGAPYRRNFTERPDAICATLNHWGVAESMKFTTRYVLPAVPSVGMDELEAGDEVEAHPLCLGTTNRIQNETATPFSVARHAMDWMRPSTFATWARLLSWLFLSLATGTIFAKMSRTPRASG